MSFLALGYGRPLAGRIGDTMGKHEKPADGKPTPEKLARILRAARGETYEAKHSKPDRAEGNGEPRKASE